ncbi:MAG: YdcF family protein [Chryseolinea sp.]
MNSRLKKFLKILGYTFTFLILTGLLTHCSFSRYANKSYEKAKKEKPYDVIIVPGVPYEPKAVSSVMQMRILWAKHLYDSGYTKNIIFSGSAVYSPFIEAVAMKVIADSLGIPTDHTFSESKAEHSTENVYYSWKMAKSMGFKKIALATDPFQSVMLRSFIKKFCPDVQSIPVVFDKISLTDHPLPTIDTTDVYVKDFVSIVERESFWKRFAGTRGKRIVDEVRKEKEGGVSQE